MRLYTIDEKYIDYLRKYDKKIPMNKNETRPYIGIVLEIDNMKYYAPLSSPKSKHKKMKNTKDFRKINKGIYGAINLNNMIPVSDREAKLIDIDNISDQRYKRLLQNQYKFLREDIQQIQKNAESLHKLIFTTDEELSQHDLNIKKRCCSLKTLESVYKNFIP